MMSKTMLSKPFNSPLIKDYLVDPPVYQEALRAIKQGKSNKANRS